MKKFNSKVLLVSLLLWTGFSFSSFEDLGHTEVFENKKTIFVNTSNIQVVQKRWLDKKFLSETSLGLSFFLKGFNYMDSWSSNLSYRLFFNNYLSVHLKYSYYLNPINAEGKQELDLYKRLPVELKYAHKYSYSVGLDWYPFYGKALFHNRLHYFDVYFLVNFGQITLLNLDKKVPLYCLGFGIVQWWQSYFNTRLELLASQYKYKLPEDTYNREVFYKIQFSTGVLF